jgi:hypothetical protein
MGWKVTADDTFWASVWTIHKELATSYFRSLGSADEKHLRDSLDQFEKFYEILVRLLDEGQIALGAWLQVEVNGVLLMNIYRLQIEGNPFQALFITEGRPIFAGKAILALRDSPTEEQLKAITERLAARISGRGEL